MLQAKAILQHAWPNCAQYYDIQLNTDPVYLWDGSGYAYQTCQRMPSDRSL